MATVFDLVGKIGLEGIDGVQKGLDDLKPKVNLFDTALKGTQKSLIEVRGGLLGQRDALKASGGDLTDINEKLSENEKQLKDVNVQLAEQQKQWRNLGLGMVAAGTVITGALGLCVKAAASQETAMLRLGNTLRNVGVSYNEVKGSLDDTISSMEKATATSDDELYDAFNQLLIITGDYNDALKLLPIALDLAKGKNIDFNTAANLVGKASEGNIAQLRKLGIQVRDTATQEEILAAIQDKVGGSAKTMADGAEGGAKRIGDSLDNLAKAIGTTLLPMLTALENKISNIIDKLTLWAKENPEVLAGNVTFVGALGLLVTVMGTIVTAAPGFIAMQTAMGLGFWAMLGPLALIPLALALIVAGIVLVISDWDRLVDDFTGSHRVLTKVTKEELKKQVQAQKDANQVMLVDARATNTESVKVLKAHYGTLEGYTKQENKTLMDLARDASVVKGKALDDELKATRSAHDEKMKMLDAEYSAKVKSLDATTNAATQALQDQIDDINSQAESEARTDEDFANVKKLKLLEDAVLTAKTADDKMNAESELADFREEMSNTLKTRGRADRIESLNNQISAIQDQAANQRDAFQTEYDAQKEQEDSLYNATSERLKNEKADLEAALQSELVRLEIERQAFETAEGDKLAKLQDRLREQELDLKAFHDRELARIEAGNYTTVSQPAVAPAGGAGPLSGNTGASWWDQFVSGMNQKYTFPSFASGGIVPGSGPQLAMVHGGETITPAGQSGGIVINVAGSIWSETELADVLERKLYDRLRYQEIQSY